MQNQVDEKTDSSDLGLLQSLDRMGVGPNTLKKTYKTRLVVGFVTFSSALVGLSLLFSLPRTIVSGDASQFILCFLEYFHKSFRLLGMIFCVLFTFEIISYFRQLHYLHEICERLKHS